MSVDDHFKKTWIRAMNAYIDGHSITEIHRIANKYKTRFDRFCFKYDFETSTHQLKLTDFPSTTEQEQATTKNTEHMLNEFITSKEEEDAALRQLFE